MDWCHHQRISCCKPKVRFTAMATPCRKLRSTTKYIFLLLLCFGFCLRMQMPRRLRYATSSDFTKLEYFETRIAQKITSNSRSNVKPLSNHAANSPCSNYPKKLNGNLTNLDMNTAKSWLAIESENPSINIGGQYSPRQCTAHFKVAIIIPLRNRDVQLKVFLGHMHPIWQRQEIAYKVFVITQIEGSLFNRAKLLNAGVAEAKEDDNYDCYVLHDVDLMLENDKCLYWCHDRNPRHLAVHVDRFSYNPLDYKALCYQYQEPSTVYQKLRQILPKPLRQGLPMSRYFGGVSMISTRQFQAVNGMSNLYWGWGGEDDDLSFRVKAKGYSIENPYGRKCSFRMIPHDHEKQNAENPARQALGSYSAARMHMDGFSSLRYKVMGFSEHPLYTNITVDVGAPSREMLEFMLKYESEEIDCSRKMPWENDSTGFLT